MDNNEIKQQLQAMRCSTHGERPNVSVEGSNVRFSCCCSRFGDQVSERLAELVAGKMDDDFDNTNREN